MSNVIMYETALENVLNNDMDVIWDCDAIKHLCVIFGFTRDKIIEDLHTMSKIVYAKNEAVADAKKQMYNKIIDALALDAMQEREDINAYPEGYWDGAYSTIERLFSVKYTDIAQDVLNVKV